MTDITPNTPEEIIRLMSAHLDGKTLTGTRIEAPHPTHDITKDDTGFDFIRYRYDVVPEPLECWAVEFKDGPPLFSLVKKDAERYAAAHGHIKRGPFLMREVMP